jgi:hypothetical protein
MYVYIYKYILVYRCVYESVSVCRERVRVL